MDVVDTHTSIEITKAKLLLSIPITGFRGHVTQILVFQDEQTGESYFWIAHRYPDGLNTEGKTYHIKAELETSEGHNRLLKVKRIDDEEESSKSEQPDAEDILFGLI